MFRKDNQDKTENNDHLEEILLNEMMLSERFRLRLFGSITAFLFFWLAIVIMAFYDDLTLTFQSVGPLVFSMFALLFITFRQFNIARLLNNRIKEGRPISLKLQTINTIVEVSIPSVIIIGAAIFVNSIEMLSTPVAFIYLIIISLSILSLNPKLSLIAGLVAAVEYLIIAVVLLNIFPPLQHVTVLNSYFAYLGKFLMIGLGGVIAAFISYQLRKRIVHSHQISDERNKIKNLFGQQISQEIVQELLVQKSEIESKRLFVCVMFLDIRGYTNFAEDLEPEDIIKYQNDVFGFMIEKISSNNGIINQFLGDGYMATFGAPIPKGNVSKNAVKAAREIITELEKQNIAGKIPETKIGIGLHAGYVVAGNVGTDIRKQYSISGNTVILSSRVEQLTKKYEVPLLITRDVFEGIDEMRNDFDSLGEVYVKGRAEPIEIFKINNNPQIEIEL